LNQLSAYLKDMWIW